MEQFAMNEICVAVATISIVLMMAGLIVVVNMKRRMLREIRRQLLFPFDLQEEEPEQAGEPEKKSLQGEYRKLFLQPVKRMSGNKGWVNIKAEYHEKISSLVRANPNQKLTISGYTNAVLEQHFLLYGKEIEKIIRQKGCQTEVWK